MQDSCDEVVDQPRVRIRASVAWRAATPKSSPSCILLNRCSEALRCGDQEEEVTNRSVGILIDDPKVLCKLPTQPDVSAASLRRTGGLLVGFLRVDETVTG